MIDIFKASRSSFFRKRSPVSRSLPIITIGFTLLIVGFVNSNAAGMSRCPDTKETN